MINTLTSHVHHVVMIFLITINEMKYTPQNWHTIKLTKNMFISLPTGKWISSYSQYWSSDLKYAVIKYDLTISINDTVDDNQNYRLTQSIYNLSPGYHFTLHPHPDQSLLVIYGNNTYRLYIVDQNSSVEI